VVGEWSVLLAERLNAYKQDLAAEKAGETDRVTGLQKFRGQGLVYDPLEPLSADAKELHKLRYEGALAASFVPQRHIGWVNGRPVMAFRLDALWCRLDLSVCKSA
jgi:hypothetical protein